MTAAPVVGPQFRWGFLGASRIGHRALAPAVQAAGHRLHAVAARDPARARAFADAFGAPRAYGSYAELLADPGIDLVYVALPNDAHAGWTIRALDAGKHVLCEKPLALSAEEVRHLQDAERRTGRHVMEAFCHLHHPQMARVQDILGNGEIGRTVAIQAIFGNLLLPPDDFRWIAAHGGGALYDLGCYCVSAMRVLTGCEPVRAAAVPAMQGDVDATMTGQLDFGDGLVGQFACSFVSVRTQHLQMIGTKGTLFLDWPISTKGRDTRLDVNGRSEHFAATDPYVRMVEHFAAAVAGRAGMAYGLDWSLRQAQALDALFAAARTVSVVSVPR
ncbi:Gfo/Idh/MocA family protein [Limobrevibacterium gyesilva]|uniref:Gfo/Idh/MocA family oxidoreductase n=1 Tax=Limobrevibacterium gyesilva TaxID=2991712 RepID=A0AA41YQL8_9PROT|nr:Gfo/Idh/MocA family oxidoreductase [Limobrevibacterium gyesilva]